MGDRQTEIGAPVTDDRGDEEELDDASSEQDLTVLVARDAVAKMAPQELPLFKANSDAYFTDRDRALSDARSSDDMLGFGAGVAIAFLTPYALDVVRDVLQFFADEIKGTVRAEGKGVFAALLRRFRHKDAPPKTADVPVEDEEPIRPSQEELIRLREVAIEKAAALGLSEKNQELLADSIVGSLALG